jgi:hypothetical protein
MAFSWEGNATMRAKWAGKLKQKPVATHPSTPVLSVVR